MGGFSSGPLVDLLQPDLPKHPNHVWKAHCLGVIRPFSRRKVVVLPARPRPTKHKRTTGSGATPSFWCSKESFCKRSRSSSCRERKQIHANAFDQHCMESSHNTINEGYLCDRRAIEFMRHLAMSTTQLALQKES